MSPFDLTGGPFLQLYGILFALTVIAGLLIPRWLRPEGHVPRSPDVDQLAFLAGGKPRFADALVSRLLARRALAMTGKKFLADRRERGEGAAEASVLALSQPMPWRAIERTLKPYAEDIEAELVSSGLLMDGSTTLQMRFWQTLPYLLLVGFGAIKLDVGLSRDRPVGILTVFLIVTAVLALLRFVIVDRRTRRGRATLHEARAQTGRLRRAATAPETGMAVALYGTAVLAGSGWADFHRMRTANSGGDSGSSGGDGGGGCGGGGGGGCGGCGS
ncbi:MAG: TIGR04222 domain-containing membrane protein [Pseudomonadota bacterium]